jgi:N-acetylglucosaminyl-diphospho-decaprenol L-rhamnosyltransferase
MVSLLIVNWNTRDLLAECLASLPEALVGTEYEAIVADNGSWDGSAEMVAEHYPSVRLLKSERNLGYAAANNRIAAMARGEHLLFLNADTRLLPNSVPLLIRRVEQGSRVALAAPQLLSPDGSIQASCRAFPRPAAVFWEAVGLARLFPQNWRIASYRMRWFDHASAREVEQPMATCWLVPRAAWEAVGPFDEQFPIFFNDVDWCARAKALGFSIWFDPAAKVIHHGAASTRQVRRSMIWESHRSLLRYYRKHFRGRSFHLWYWVTAACAWIGAWIRAKGWHAGFRPDDHGC